jgi:IS5 family transposase
MEIWKPPVEPSRGEAFIIKRCKGRRVFVFLRELRHRIFDEEIQSKLQAAYSKIERGDERVPPAQLGLAMLLQAALRVPDHEVVELTVMDKRWQMVLGCMGAEEPLFSQGTFFNFRQRMIEHGLDQLLFDKTVQLARETGGFSSTHLRAAFDASPLWGAGRVEDTFNLIGRAALQVVRSAAQRLGKPVEKVALEAGIPVLTATSVKTGLDIDWDDPKARTVALGKLLGQVQALGRFLEKEFSKEISEPPLAEQWALVQKLIAQDTEPDPEDGGGRRVTQGVAKDRRISVSDPDMRHGRKSKRKRIDGYKRHVAVQLDTPGIICAVAVTPANQSERVAAADLLAQCGSVSELYIDRGYLGDEAIEERREQGTEVFCKPFPLHNAGRFTKADFEINLETDTIRCPQGISVEAHPGSVAHFPADRCVVCPQRELCTRAAPTRGRSITLHPQEPFFIQLRKRARTPDGRTVLRKRIAVEHRLAAIHNRQGDRARYRGLQKNLFDLRRYAALNNLSVVDQLRRAA